MNKIYHQMDFTRGSAVTDFYRAKTVFVTGASGSIGKVLIWKLLLSCSGIETIYLLIRPKKGKAPQSRLDELLRIPIFDNFKEKNPQILNKVKAIPGNMLEDRLGLSEDDERVLVNSVHVIFHVAAIVKFDLDLKDAVDMNVGGTQKLLELAMKMPNLQAFVHTSTAYSCCDVPVLEEKLYKAQEVPQNVLDLVKLIKPEILRSNQKDLIEPHPNTYTYSKRLAEDLVAKYYPQLPIVLTRPTIVGPCQMEPIPGWSDSIHSSLISVSIAIGKGALRVILQDPKCHPDIIPVDMVCNALILAAWKMGQDSQRPKAIPVYNLGQVEYEPISNAAIAELGHRIAHMYPFSVMMWYPFLILTSNFYVYTVLSFFLQWIPAYLVDTLLFALRQKRFMVQIQRRIHQGIKVSCFFMLREWHFVKNNILQLRDELSDKDRKTFKVSCKDVNADEYFLNALLVTRWYLMKEDPANLPTARRRLKIYYALHRSVQLSFCLFVGWVLWSYTVEPLLIKSSNPYYRVF